MAALRPPPDVDGSARLEEAAGEQRSSLNTAPDPDAHRDRLQPLVELVAQAFRDASSLGRLIGRQGRSDAAIVALRVQTMASGPSVARAAAAMVASAPGRVVLSVGGSIDASSTARGRPRSHPKLMARSVTSAAVPA